MARSSVRALRLGPEQLRGVVVPYDVVSTEEARQLAAGNPLSFLRSPLGDRPSPDADVFAEGVRKGA